MVSCMLNSIYVLSPVQGSTREKVYEEEKVLRKKLFFPHSMMELPSSVRIPHTQLQRKVSCWSDQWSLTTLESDIFLPTTYLKNDTKN